MLVQQDLEVFLQFLLQSLICISVGAVQCDWRVYDLLIAHGAVPYVLFLMINNYGCNYSDLESVRQEKKSYA
ncbi:hypothetical protein KSF_085290 [Reticulibacter mediterranei]|uniref:Uncharacterized protein n=1 Tax=Reticulibacter mediterranei TaxID=2778369 RepID=A0A8J3J095_9CHLR|nr:hypothetical protein KSF_085290 [Reticulibacter mediterranei]